MKINVRCSRHGYFFAAVFFLSITSPANAALMKLDWKSPGDGLILRDSNTNLEWLNLTQTLNLSVNDIMGQWFGNINILPLAGTFSEFRYASKVEVGQLYTDFGIVTLDNTDIAANWIGANVAFQALGLTGSNNYGVKLQEGLSIDSPGVANAPEIVADIYAKTARAFVFPTPTLNNLYDFDGKRATMGSYLVRDVSTVPIPTSFWIFSSGLVGLFGFMRKR